MAVGIAGDSTVTIGGLPAPDLADIELRVISNLLQQISNTLSLPLLAAQDELNTLRTDQAFELGIPTPLPGNTM